MSIKHKKEAFISLSAGECIILSIAHHWLNFWGLPWSEQLFTVIVVAPLLSIVIFTFLKIFWNDIIRIHIGRWILFLIPVLVVASIFTWRTYTLPSFWHHLEIDPVNVLERQVQIIEIKNSSGSRIDLSTLTSSQDWSLEQKKLVNRQTEPDPISLTFFGPIGKPVNIIFLVTEPSTNLRIILDGQETNTTLHGSLGSQSLLQIDTRYEFGIDGTIIVFLVVFIDLLSFTLLCTIPWLIQEVTWKLAPKSETLLSRSHFSNYLILLSVALIFHLFNSFSVPLIVLSDSPSYLSGAYHWIAFGNLAGIPDYRGPGATFLFTPIVLLFGRNPWGIKILLHLLAIAIVPLTYRVSWQLSHLRGFAFMAGLLAAFTPDLFYFSNIVMMEVPNVFLGLLFCTLFYSAMENYSLKWMALMMLVSAFYILIRQESLIIILIGGGFLLAKMLFEWREQASGEGRLISHKILISRLKKFSLACSLAIFPLLAWSAYNYSQKGIFGITDHYQSEILYDGWIYYSESNNFHITDNNSRAVNMIEAALPPDVRMIMPLNEKKSSVLTGWQVYSYLMDAGYSSDEAFQILESAAMDSIKSNPMLTVEQSFRKLKEGFLPRNGPSRTYFLPGETIKPLLVDASPYFDPENISIPAFINLQRGINRFLLDFYRTIYQYWVWYCLGAIFIGIYRKSFWLWGFLAIITALRIFVPTLIGLSDWRYVISGIIFMEIFGLAWLFSLVNFILLAWHRQCANIIH